MMSMVDLLLIIIKILWRIVSYVYTFFHII